LGGRLLGFLLFEEALEEAFFGFFGGWGCAGSGGCGFGLGFFEVERLVLGLFGAGSGVLLLGTSSSRIISLLLD
jgi:hypothetical protein